LFDLFCRIAILRLENRRHASILRVKTHSKAMTEAAFQSIVKAAMTDLSSKRLSTYFAIFLAYITVWADVIFSIPGPSAFSALWFIVSVLKNAVRIGFVLYICAQMRMAGAPQRLRALRRLPSRRELRGALLVMLLSVACAGLGVFVSALFHTENPLLSLRRHLPAGLIPLMLLSSLSVGYAEELFFRFFLIDALVEAGTPIHTAASASVLIFALSHYAQGFSGIAFAGVLAVFYTRLRFKGYDIHALALGHALYDAIVLAIVLL